MLKITTTDTIGTASTTYRKASCKMIYPRKPSINSTTRRMFRIKMKAHVMYKMHINFLQGNKSSFDWRVGMARSRRSNINATTTKNPKTTIWIHKPAKTISAPVLDIDSCVLAISPAPVKSQYSSYHELGQIWTVLYAPASWMKKQKISLITKVLVNHWRLIRLYGSASTLRMMRPKIM